MLPIEGVGMSAAREGPTTAAGGDEIQLSAAGDHVKGEFRCADCGHAITVCRELPMCEMCGGESWRAGTWRPFARSL
jgi:Zn finger protein HypA/HybF involved in hydrogenase expression